MKSHASELRLLPIRFARQVSLCVSMPWASVHCSCCDRIPSKCTPSTSVSLLHDYPEPDHDRSTLLLWNLYVMTTFACSPVLTTTSANRSGYVLYCYPVDILLDFCIIQLPIPIFRPSTGVSYDIAIIILVNSKCTRPLPSSAQFSDVCLNQLLLTPPQPHSAHPTVTISLPSPQSELVLDLKTTSLLGSRAKLADLPKLHELITTQVSASTRPFQAL